MPAIGRLLLQGLEDPELPVAMFTFLSHLSPLLPHPHLFSPFPAHPRTGQVLFTEAAVCSEPVPQSPYEDSVAVGVGGAIQWHGGGWVRA